MTAELEAAALLRSTARLADAFGDSGAALGTLLLERGAAFDALRAQVEGLSDATLGAESRLAIAEVQRLDQVILQAAREEMAGLTRERDALGRIRAVVRRTASVRAEPRFVTRHA